ALASSGTGTSNVIVTFGPDSEQPTRIADLGALIEAQGDPPFSFACGRAGGLVHDPGSSSVVVGDTCNNLLWVLGYTKQNGPLSVKAVIRPPMLGRLGYDPPRHILWSGAYGISMDLSTL